MQYGVLCPLFVIFILKAIENENVFYTYTYIYFFFQIDSSSSFLNTYLDENGTRGEFQFHRTLLIDAFSYEYIQMRMSDRDRKHWCNLFRGGANGALIASHQFISSAASVIDRSKSPSNLLVAAE